MKNSSRRDFLKLTGLGAASLMASTASASEGVKLGENDVGMFYDATKCVGCKACVAACKRVNDMDAVPAPNDEDRLWDAPGKLDYRTRNIIQLYKEDEETWSYVKHQCMHCVKPGCVSACPVTAMMKDERGIVYYDKDKCIGCRYCQIACPFVIPKFEWPKAFPKIVKCDLCKFTNLKEKGIPACCEVCPTEAVIFGKRSDLLAEAKRRMETEPEKYQEKIYGEHEIGGTNVIYLAPQKVNFAQLGFPELETHSYAAFSENIQHTIYKGFIAPVALYSLLTFVAIRNRKKNDGSEDEE
ncbi:hydrogenase 2 operon protein HybA [Limisalsivibrio acetivorans]|uniref:hydrogenase 2 operon protein HybA n=1 Tax=Limisalsivibrio acetivorans TaxID=1304888 RepID=UPI0003B7392D|nr:hydrogenase 2 operon protein HybA [Limisalsivibrio acetivorans]